jgi:phenylalanyl-tRNA synthetase beta chain
VTTATQSIFIEAAYFSPEIIRTRAREYGLQTDASYRFERGVDSSQQRRALARASDLVVEICGGQLGPICEVKKSKCLPKRKSIVLRRDRLDQVLGVSVKEATVSKILRDLNLFTAKHASGWKVKPPDYRFDIEGEHDVIEEVARLFGFGDIPNRLPRIMVSKGLGSEKEMPIDSLENYLVNQDFSEVITYSFVDKMVQERLASLSRSLTPCSPLSLAIYSVYLQNQII